MYLDNLTNDYAKMCMSAYCADFDNFIKYYDVKKLVATKYRVDSDDKMYYIEKYPDLSDLPETDYLGDPLEVYYPDEVLDRYPDRFPNWSNKLKLAAIYEELGGNYYEDKLNNLHLLTYILAYTCRHNFIFAHQLRHSGLELNELVYEAISASFIQHGYLEDYFIRIYKPLCIWYPKHPSKETCLKLLKVHDFYKYSVAYLSVVMGWEDMFIKANIDCGFKDLYNFAHYFNRDGIKQKLEKFPIIFANVYSKSKIFTGYGNIGFIDEAQNFGDTKLSGWGWGEDKKKLNDDTFVKYKHRIEYALLCANVGNISKLGLGYKMFKNNILLPMGKELPFGLSNKYVAYIGDLQYYQGGDFEYAKWGALNNSIFANYIINNKDKFPDYVIRNAVSNMLINHIIDEELVIKYKPFYFYNFQMVHYTTYAEELISKVPSIKANTLFSLANTDFIYTSCVQELLIPDIDIVRILSSNNQLHDCLDDLINKAKEQGFFYKHLDFENECNFDEPKKIPFDSVDLDDLKNQPLAVYQEGLDITEFGLFSH
ncbi:Rf4p protein [Monosporozyma servazzii]